MSRLHVTTPEALVHLTKTAKFDGDRRVHALAPITIESGHVVVKTMCGIEAGPARPGWGLPTCKDCEAAS